MIAIQSVPAAPAANWASLVQENASDFKVATHAYSDPEVFRSELQRIFESTWIYLCHESELPSAGDYKLAWIGQHPIIVVRDATGAVNAFLNFCPHRGATLCREEAGHVKTFSCPYHGWSFRTSGELIAPTDAAAYPPEFDGSTKGLVPVAHVRSYGGLVFGCMASSVVSLEDYMGEAKQHVDLWLKRCAGGSYRVATAHKYAYNGNWKFQAENVLDGYHAGFVHRSAYNTFRKFEGMFQNRHYGAVRPTGQTRGFEGGHGTIEAGVPLEARAVDPALREAYVRQLGEMYGESASGEILGNRHVLLFPSVVIMDFNIRVIQPRAHDRTEVYSYPMQIEGMHPRMNTARLHDIQSRVGTAGIVNADDIETFNGNQTAVESASGQWLTLARGLGVEQVLDSGERVGRFADETPQRAFWRQWASMMASGQ
jgi:nitrite reductase/ring-hydroxylating ferredoxin subunit